jgi:hypothetical protein
MFPNHMRATLHAREAYQPSQATLATEACVFSSFFCSGLCGFNLEANGNAPQAKQKAFEPPKLDYDTWKRHCEDLRHVLRSMILRAG